MNENLERIKFTERFWYYYMMLENDCTNLQRYIDFREENMGTCSDEIIKQFLTVCAEFDNLCKAITEIEGDSDIRKYGEWFFADEGYGKIGEATIVLRRNKTEIKPFAEWKNTSTMPWWTAHNHVKHQRSDNYSQGNLGNLIYAMAALYYLECFQYRKIAKSNLNDNEINFDVPPAMSELFYLKDFKTTFSAIGQDLIAEIN